MTDAIQQVATAGTRVEPRAQSSADAAVITSDFEAFLRLLTTQMENQDPLNPLDANDLATQLATFSGVEQQVRTNQLLESLASGARASGLGDLAGWIGMEARVAMPVNFTGQTTTFVMRPPSFADRVQLVVSGADGLEVQRIDTGVAAGPLTWDGRDELGLPLPDGTYTLTMEAFAGGEVIETRPVEIYARVEEALRRDGETWLGLSDGGEIAASEVLGVRAPDG